MIYSLYLDDERQPRTARDWVVARSVAEAQHLCAQRGCPQYISFDHDLGDGVPTGMDFAKWLVEQDLESGGRFIPPEFDFNVHSANGPGAANISGLLTPYLDQRG